MRSLSVAVLLLALASVSFADPPRPHTQVPPDPPDVLKRLPAALRGQVMVVEPIDFTTVTIDIKNDTITIEGETPVPRKVHLVPHRHVRRPNFWAYEIVAEKRKKGDNVIQVVTPYKKTLKMGDWKGKKGIEILGEMRVGKKTVIKKLKVIIK